MHMIFTPRCFTDSKGSFLKKGAPAFNKKVGARTKKLEQKIDKLEKKLTQRNEVLSELMEEHVAQKNTWGSLRATWVPHDTRDQLMDFIRCWSDRSWISASKFIGWLDIGSSKYYDWKRSYGKINEHNGWIPRDFWIEDWERKAIVFFFLSHPDQDYRRVAYMLIDEDVVAVSPSTVYRVLRWESFKDFSIHLA